MKKFFFTALLILTTMVIKANTYVHYNANDSTEWCHIYNDNGTWMGAFCIEWTDDNPVGKVTVFNWSDKWTDIMRPPKRNTDRHVYLQRQPKDTSSLFLALQDK